jgi:hypothetical protein
MEFEQTVRSQIPAEQLIHWIKEICHPEVLKRIEGVWVGSEYEANEVVPETDIPALVRELKSYFEDLHARICLERGDVDEARKIVEQKRTELLERAEALTKNELEVARKKNELDRIECLVRICKCLSICKAARGLTSASRMGACRRVPSILPKLSKTPNRESRPFEAPVLYLHHRWMEWWCHRGHPAVPIVPTGPCFGL